MEKFIGIGMLMWFILGMFARVQLLCLVNCHPLNGIDGPAYLWPLDMWLKP